MSKKHRDAAAQHNASRASGTLADGSRSLAEGAKDVVLTHDDPYEQLGGAAPGACRIIDMVNGKVEDSEVQAGGTSVARSTKALSLTAPDSLEANVGGRNTTEASRVSARPKKGLTPAQRRRLSNSIAPILRGEKTTIIDPETGKPVIAPLLLPAGRQSIIDPETGTLLGVVVVAPKGRKRITVYDHKTDEHLRVIDEIELITGALKVEGIEFSTLPPDPKDQKVCAGPDEDVPCPKEAKPPPGAFQDRQVRKRAYRPWRCPSCSALVKWANMSPEEKEKRSASRRAAWAKPGAKEKLSALSKAMWAKPGAKEKLSASSKAMWAKPGAREKQRVTLQAARANMSPEEKEKLSASKQAWWANMSPEEKERRCAALNLITPEQIAERGAKISASKQAWWANMSPEEREKQLALVRAGVANMSPEERARTPEARKKQSDSMRAVMANLTPEQLAERGAKISASRRANAKRATPGSSEPPVSR